MNNASSERSQRGGRGWTLSMKVCAGLMAGAVLLQAYGLVQAERNRVQQLEQLAALEQRVAAQEAAVKAEQAANAPRAALVDELIEQRRAAEEAERRRLAEEEARRTELASRGVARQLDVEVTGYCGGGVTATGQDVNTSREGAMCIAVDPSVIPLGSRVRLSFEEPWAYLDGVYIASDTGGAIVGNIVDLYFGVDGYSEAMDFGRRTATAEVLY